MEIKENTAEKFLIFNFDCCGFYNQNYTEEFYNFILA